MLKRFVVKTNERGVLLRDGDYECMLNAGSHYFIDPMSRLSLVTWALDAPTAVDTLQQRSAGLGRELRVHGVERG